MPKYIIFRPHPPNRKRKTRIWSVETKDGGDGLGDVRWYAPWRKYVFQPYDHLCVFEQDCLRDIAEFLETETRKHRENNAKLRDLKEQAKKCGLKSWPKSIDGTCNGHGVQWP